MNTQPPLSATESLGVMLSLVRAEIVRSMEDELTASGLDLSYTQFLILKKLAKLGPMSASNLARTVELDGGAMTRQLDQLERKDYLRRCPHEQDRRALRIELTEAGAAQSQQLTDCSARVLEAAQRSLSEIERTQLHDYLTRVLHALRDKN
jgi:DNA-binding MarR family transcriptional regulator